MMAPSPVFDETYRDYLSRIEGVDLARRAPILGIDVQGDGAVMSFFNKSYAVGANGVSDERGERPPLAICIVLFKYLLLCPMGVPANGGLVTFKDFKDAAPLVDHFGQTIQGEVCRRFGGRAADLEKSCIEVGGSAYDGGLSYQVKFKFQALSRVPIYLLFNDAEEGFEAQCTILFERSTEVYLDMESLAIVAGSLVQNLKSILKNIDG